MAGEGSSVDRPRLAFVTVVVARGATTAFAASELLAVCLTGLAALRYYAAMQQAGHLGVPQFGVPNRPAGRY